MLTQPDVGEMILPSINLLHTWRANGGGAPLPHLPPLDPGGSQDLQEEERFAAHITACQTLPRWALAGQGVRWARSKACVKIVGWDLSLLSVACGSEPKYLVVYAGRERLILPSLIPAFESAVRLNTGLVCLLGGHIRNVNLKKKAR